MSVQLTPSKRPHDRSGSEANGRGKWQKPSRYSSPNASLKSTSTSTIFRLLCPDSKISSLIAEDGGVISQICKDSGAKVVVEEPVSGCDERVVVISGQDEVGAGAFEVNKGEDEESKAGDELSNEDEHGEDNVEKPAVPSEDAQSEKIASSVQKAVLLVFEKMVEEESEMNGGEEDSDKGNSLLVRLVVLSNQVGCLLGKAGSVIKQMSSESGAQIRILPRDKLPSCASSADELVQISGDVGSVRKALQLVSQQLLFENTSRDADSLPSNHSGQSSHSFRNNIFPNQATLHDIGGGNFGHLGPARDILTYRLICPDEKVGGVIGKGGSIIRALQHETGCDIKVLDPTPDSEDRIIVISAPANPDEPVSAAQDAVLRVQARIVRAAPESKEKTVISKIIVSSHQIGCLLGKGGSVIAEMRKSTGAHIRILGKDHTPEYASENEEVVQINGDFEAVQEALLQITIRLRNHFLRDAFPSINHFPSHGFPDHGPPYPPFAGRREFSPPGRFSSFNQFDVVNGLPPHGRFHPHDDHPPFSHGRYRPGFPPHFPERMPPPGPWGPQGPVEVGGPGGRLGFPDYPGVPQRRFGGFGGGSHQPIITSTTVEVVVPRSVVPAIYGEDGGCLKQIRVISDAKITITDPKPGATETLIIISGTPEQTHAAQSLIQAFVISETEAA